MAKIIRQAAPAARAHAHFQLLRRMHKQSTEKGEEREHDSDPANQRDDQTRRVLTEVDYPLMFLLEVRTADAYAIGKR